MANVKKKKLESTLVNMVGILTLITLISAAILGMVYNLTKEKIAYAQEQKKLKAINQVILPGYDNSPNAEMFQIDSFDKPVKLNCYPAKNGDEIKSIAIETFTMKGYNGEIKLMVGFLPDGTINKISVISQKETPGLGTKMLSPKFLKQFQDRNPDEFKINVKKDGGDIDAITAATISSRAFCDAVNRAYKSYKQYTSTLGK